MVAVITFLFLIHGVLCINAPVSGESPKTSLERIMETFHEVREESVTIREEAQQIRQEGYAAISKAYQIKDEAYEVKDEAYEARSELESLLIDTFVLLKSQTTASNLYIHEIRNTLAAINKRMDSWESQLDSLDSQMQELKGTVDESQSQLSAKVESSLTLSATVNSRIKAWMSEVRLISLFKAADMNAPHPTYGPGVVTDGQFMMSHQVHSEMRTHCHSDNTGGKLRNNKLWIDLGGFFRIHRVHIWNYRNCCLDQLVGTHVYADEALLGAVIESAHYHDIMVPEGDPTYASKITLHQPLAKNIHVLEVQVWGSGPFNEDDLFA